MKIRYLAALTPALALLSWAPLKAETAQERLGEATQVFNEIMQAKDNSIPQELLDSAHCVVIVPGVKKVAFGVGGKYGRGFVICRNPSDRGWGAPAAVRMEGGSIGWQIGGSESDVVLLVMNDEGMRHLLDDKFTLDADASVAAGPVGRTGQASTDAKLTAGILGYSRSRGAFAGLSVGGATLRNDLDENAELYGRKITNREVLSGAVKPPAAADELRAALNRYSHVEEGTRARTTETEKK